MEKEITKQNEEQKPKFYVFSGIENTLVSKNFIKAYYSGMPGIYGDIRPDPTCINALDYLLDHLEEKFDTKLVITSKRRISPDSCEHYLRLNNLQYNKPIFFTRYINGPRGEKIIDFLDREKATPLTYHTAPFYIRFLKNLKSNPDFNNYVVIDGKNRHFSKYIPHSQIKIVSRATGFTLEDADKILYQNGITLAPQTEVQSQNKN